MFIVLFITKSGALSSHFSHLMCSHVVWSCGGDGFNGFLMDITLFWCIICLCSWNRSYLPPKNVWWQFISVLYRLSLISITPDQSQPQNVISKTLPVTWKTSSLISGPAVWSFLHLFWSIQDSLVWTRNKAGVPENKEQKKRGDRSFLMANFLFFWMTLFGGGWFIISVCWAEPVENALLFNRDIMTKM